MGHDPRASTLNTHNSALNRVFDEAVARGYMNRTHVPVLINKGRDSERRPDFRREEYRKMIATLPNWIDKGRESKSRDMRHLLRDDILILANTGIRHGTEAQNLRWKHIHLFHEDGLTYLEMHVNGKTGPRDLMCRIGVIKAFREKPESQLFVKRLISGPARAGCISLYSSICIRGVSSAGPSATA